MSSTTPDPTTSEAPEVRDAEELNESQSRTTIAGVPIGIDGRPMTLISMAVSDKVPTVQFGNVVVGPVTITRYIDDLGDGDVGRQHRIDRGRELQRDAEFICGVERRLLQYAVDPASKIASPVTGHDAFAAPPPSYDPSRVPDPRVDAQASTAAIPAIPPPPSSPAYVPPAPEPRDVMDQARANNPNPPAAPTPAAAPVPATGGVQVG